MPQIPPDPELKAIESALGELVPRLEPARPRQADVPGRGDVEAGGEPPLGLAGDRGGAWRRSWPVSRFSWGPALPRGSSSESSSCRRPRPVRAGESHPLRVHPGPSRAPGRKSPRSEIGVSARTSFACPRGRSLPTISGFRSW